MGRNFRVRKKCLSIKQQIREGKLRFGNVHSCMPSHWGKNVKPSRSDDSNMKFYSILPHHHLKFMLQSCWRILLLKWISRRCQWLDRQSCRSSRGDKQICATIEHIVEKSREIESGESKLIWRLLIVKLLCLAWWSVDRHICAWSIK